MTWSSDNATADRTYGGSVQNNVFTSGPSGYFGYGISVAGHHDATVTGNDGTGGNWGGEASNVYVPGPQHPSQAHSLVSCRGTWVTPAAFVIDPSTTPNVVAQPEFTPASIQFMICNEPGAILSHGYIATTILATSTPYGAQAIVPSNDLALSAVATSSTGSLNLQGPEKSNDGIIGGVTSYGGDGTTEWASNQKTGSSLTLTWSKPVPIGSVILYDRPNLYE